MHVGQLLHSLEQFHLVGVAVQGTYADDEAEIGRFISKGVLGGQRSGCAKHHQKGQYQAEQPFHQGYLLFFQRFTKRLIHGSALDRANHHTLDEVALQEGI